ncbi:substance-K receptor-like [Actinia tenebrosa]|uniref:Substance-K receptor-like n=1 Tax=Actinia tenebrosa TaxID=6105 RepID=A0A6P8J0T9_ACTTE|nr:substance-K receptor-like [Actinia tenebrosa]XP_031573497.1 substance-K receptor-like [Actinia tenebrosa]
MNESNASVMSNTSHQQRNTLDSTTQIAMLSAYSINFTLALSGNILILYIVMTKPYMKSTINFLIANMAVADLLMALFAMPYSMFLLYFGSLWFGGLMGQLTCKVVQFIIGLSIAASIVTLIVISLDRFFAIVYPFRRSRIIKKISITITAIWLTAAILIGPLLYIYKTETDNSGNFRCIVSFGEDIVYTFQTMRIYNTVVFAVLYFAPLVLIALFYLAICRKLWLRKIPGNPSAMNLRTANKSKKRSIKMLIIIVFVFAICWLPVHIMHYYIFYRHDIYNRFPPYVSLVAFFVSHANSAINPFLYIILNKNFMKAFLDIAEKLMYWRHSNGSRANTSTSMTNLSIVAKDHQGLSFGASFEGKSGHYHVDKADDLPRPFLQVSLVKASQLTKL